VQEEQPTLPTPARAAKKAKIDGIWAALNGGGAGSPAVGGSTPLGAAYRLESGDIGRGTTLASLCQPIKQTASVVDPDKVHALDSSMFIIFVKLCVVLLTDWPLLACPLAPLLPPQHWMKGLGISNSDQVRTLVVWLVVNTHCLLSQACRSGEV
jgi:hypothetical protein